MVDGRVIFKYGDKTLNNKHVKTVKLNYITSSFFYVASILKALANQKMQMVGKSLQNGTKVKKKWGSTSYCTLHKH